MLFSKITADTTAKTIE